MSDPREARSADDLVAAFDGLRPRLIGDVDGLCTDVHTKEALAAGEDPLRLIVITGAVGGSYEPGEFG